MFRSIESLVYAFLARAIPGVLLGLCSGRFTRYFKEFQKRRFSWKVRNQSAGLLPTFGKRFRSTFSTEPRISSWQGFYRRSASAFSPKREVKTWCARHPGLQAPKGVFLCGALRRPREGHPGAGLLLGHNGSGLMILPENRLRGPPSERQKMEIY